MIEFPSLLLPPGTQSGSIVSISVQRDLPAESSHQKAFTQLQSLILSTYGQSSPAPPQLILRNTTQTSVTLEWGKLELATAKLKGVDIYRNGTRLASIPNATVNTSTKLSSLALDTDYTFQLVMLVYSKASSSSLRTVDKVFTFGSFIGRPQLELIHPTSFESELTPSGTFSYRGPSLVSAFGRKLTTLSFLTVTRPESRFALETSKTHSC